MERVQTHLFIGGVQDGNREVFSDIRDRIVFPKTPPVSFDEEALSAKLEEIIYRREYLRAGDTVFSVWVEESLSTTDALRRLVENYQPMQEVIS